MKSHVPVNPGLLEAALDLVRGRTGLVFSQARLPAFESGLLAAMHRAEIDDVSAYLRALGDGSTALDDLVAEITVGETYFLRDPEQWAEVRTRLLPPLLARGDRPIRIWSAGCASGEEPYSAAILLHQLGAAGRGMIVGTDISRPALARARRAEYSDWALRNVPEDVTRTYFRRVGRHYELLPAIRHEVEFRYLNLADESPSAQARPRRDGSGLLPERAHLLRRECRRPRGAAAAGLAQRRRLAGAGSLGSPNRPHGTLRGGNDGGRADVSARHTGDTWRLAASGVDHAGTVPRLLVDCFEPTGQRDARPALGRGSEAQRGPGSRSPRRGPTAVCPQRLR